MISTTNDASLPVLPQDLSRDAAYLPVSRQNAAAGALGKLLNAIAVVSPARAASLLNRWVWCRPPRYPARADDAAALAGAVPMPLYFKQYVLPAYSWGNGPTVLLVHGWGGAAGQMAHLAPPLVAAGFRVVAFDAPAHGAAPGTHTDFPEITEAVRMAAQAVGGLHAAVCHSAGSVAMLRAMRQGMKVERLALLSAFSQLRLPLAAMAATLKLNRKVQKAHLSLLTRLYGPDFIEDYSPERLVRGLNQPGLLVHDKSDREFGAANATRLLGAWPSAGMHLTEGLGHYRLLKDAHVAQRVADFVSAA